MCIFHHTPDNTSTNYNRKQRKANHFQWFFFEIIGESCKAIFLIIYPCSTHLKIIIVLNRLHGFLWALGPLLLKAQHAVDPTNPWLDPANSRLDEFSSDEEDYAFILP